MPESKNLSGPASSEEKYNEKKPSASDTGRDRLGKRLPSLGGKERFAGPLARCGLIGIITLCLLIPLGFVQDIVYERMTLYSNATSNITTSWGQAQTVSGPALIIPYQVWVDKKEIIKVKEGDREVPKEVVTREHHTRFKVVLPSKLTFDTVIDPEIRYRGIYRQALYNAPVSVSGAFHLPSREDFAEQLSQVYWESAWFCVGITNLKTISEATPLNWDGKTLAAYQPGNNVTKLLGPGFHTRVPLTKQDAGADKNFSLRLHIRGSGGIYFTPVGENTTITMKGSWPSPSFQGNLLPVERSISEEGFSARWAISNLTRTYPQIADLNSDAYRDSQREGSAITTFTAGMDLHEPVTLYRMVRRSVDYGILFIAVTFVALFVFEIASHRRMHLIQYVMVGLSMSLFYLVLLSLAEHTSFGLAFVAAGAVTILMNSAYVGAVLQSMGKGLLMGGLLSGLYAVLFSLLRMEDFSLLLGTGLVLVMMGTLMFMTRKLPLTQIPR